MEGEGRVSSWLIRMSVLLILLDMYQYVGCTLIQCNILKLRMYVFRLRTERNQINHKLMKG